MVISILLIYKYLVFVIRQWRVLQGMTCALSLGVALTLDSFLNYSTRGVRSGGGQS